MSSPREIGTDAAQPTVVSWQTPTESVETSFETSVSSQIPSVQKTVVVYGSRTDRVVVAFNPSVERERQANLIANGVTDVEVPTDASSQ